jgi:hypothetical protein
VESSSLKKINTSAIIKEIIVRCQGVQKNGETCNQRLFDILTNYEPLRKTSPIEIVCSRDHYPYSNGKRYKAVNVVTFTDSGVEIEVYYIEKKKRIEKELQDSHF